MDGRNISTTHVFLIFTLLLITEALSLFNFIQTFTGISCTVCGSIAFKKTSSVLLVLVRLNAGSVVNDNVDESFKQ